MNKQVTTSAKERMEYPINFFCSGLDCPMDPSEIFKAIESDALHICEDKLNFSFAGKSEVYLSIISPKSIAFCQIISFSNLNLFMV